MQLCAPRTYGVVVARTGVPVGPASDHVDESRRQLRVDRICSLLGPSAVGSSSKVQEAYKTRDTRAGSSSRRVHDFARATVGCPMPASQVSRETAAAPPAWARSANQQQPAKTFHMKRDRACARDYAPMTRDSAGHAKGE